MKIKRNATGSKIYESSRCEMFKKENNQEIPKLNSDKAYEILMNVFKECNVKPPADCYKYFEKDAASIQRENEERSEEI